MKRYLLALVAAIALSHPAFAAHTLTRVGTSHNQKNFVEAKVSNQNTGVILSGLPQTKTKLCPTTGNSTATGAHNCFTGSLSYNLPLAGRVKGYTFSRVRSDTNGIYGYTHQIGGSNKVITSPHRAESAAHHRHFIANTYKITGPVNNYRVKVDLRVKLFQPVGVAALEAGDTFKCKHLLYVDAYNYIYAEWVGGTTNKWKISGLTQPIGGGAPTQISEYISHNTNAYVEKTYPAYHQVGNNQNFTHQTWCNADGAANAWQTTYGIVLDNNGPADPDKTIKFRNHCWVTIVETAELP